MTSCERGDIVLVPFPFTDLETHKKRPALVLAVIDSKTLPDLLILAMITSQIDGEMIQGDVLFKDWQRCGLIHPSKLRLAKLVSVEEKIVIEKLGVLPRSGMKMVRQEIGKIFS